MSSQGVAVCTASHTKHRNIDLRRVVRHHSRVPMHAGGCHGAKLGRVAQVRIGTTSMVCDVDEIVSATEFTLRPPLIPTADITAGCAYTMGRSWYELPADFLASWNPIEGNVWCDAQYVPFDEWHVLERYYFASGSVRHWSIGPVPNQCHKMALYIEPWSSSTSDIEFVMKCRPRPLAISGQDPWNYAGTVSVAAGSTTVTGSAGVLFRQSMVGSIIRISETATRPSGTNGANPYSFQQTIVAVDADAKTLTMDAAAPSTLTAVGYTVSDPVDLNTCLYDAFLRNCEKQLAHSCGVKDADAIERRYSVALTQAKIADSATRHTQHAGSVVRQRTRLSDYPNIPQT